MEHPTTTEYRHDGHVVRYWTPQGTRFEAYNDLEWWLGTFEREQSAWAKIEEAWLRQTRRR